MTGEKDTQNTCVDCGKAIVDGVYSNGNYQCACCATERMAVEMLALACKEHDPPNGLYHEIIIDGQAFEVDVRKAGAKCRCQIPEVRNLKSEGSNDVGQNKPE